MSHIPLKSQKKFSVLDFRKFKENSQKIVTITCYDYTSARIIAKTNIDMILVGDSLGNVMMGLDNTLGVTLDHMIHYGQCVARGLGSQFLCIDMPFMSYQVDVKTAVVNAGRLMKEGGAHGVKVEGGEEICPQVRAIVNCGIPVVGHLGFTPQSIHAMGGYKIQGKEKEQKEKLFHDALKLEESGICALVLEMIPNDIATKLSRELKIPTIGIGAGMNCDGQVLVWQDVLGFNSEFKPKFLRKYLHTEDLFIDALNRYSIDVRDGLFPNDEESFK